MTEFLPCPAFGIECQYVAEVDRLSAENERLREAFKKPDAWLITDGETYWVTGFEPHPKGHPYCEIIPLYRAALGETK